MAGGELLRSLVPQPGGVIFGGLELLLQNQVNTSQQILLSRRKLKHIMHDQRGSDPPQKAQRSWE